MADDITKVSLTTRAAHCDAFANSDTATDAQRNRTFEATVTIKDKGSVCDIPSNAIPTHDFNDTERFATQ